MTRRAAASKKKSRVAKKKKSTSSAKKKKSKTKSKQKKAASRSKKKKTQKKTRRAPSNKKLTQLLDQELLLRMHDLMVKSRVLEERMIKIYRAGDAYFWIGGPGEEAFGVPLGLLTKKGQGPEYDYLHLHYRATPTLVALGMPMEASIRLIMNRKTDPCTGGRNFSNHYCFPEMNVVPVTSPIEVQYQFALGTARAQKRRNKKSLTIVTGGDAGTAEGDFASCLVWSTRPGQELPILITVQNNRWGISTPYDTQHGELHIADRGKAFGMRTRIVNGNDPVETYLALREEMDIIRETGRPSLVEARVSRLHGHSSASGANRVLDEVDCVQTYEERLIEEGLLDKDKAQEIWQRYEQEARSLTEQIRNEPVPTGDSIWNYTYVNNENADWRKF